MRSAPPIQLIGQRDLAWWIGWWIVAALAVGTTIAWCLMFWPSDTPTQRFARLLAPLVTCAAAAAGLRMAGWPRHWALRWDSQQWWLLVGRQPSPTSAVEVGGEVRATIDFGSCLLLRFTPAMDQSPAGGRRAWLWMRHSHHAVAWHGLRCAVYSPRPTLDRTASPASSRTPST